MWGSIAITVQYQYCTIILSHTALPAALLLLFQFSVSCVVKVQTSPPCLPSSRGHKVAWLEQRTNSQGMDDPTAATSQPHTYKKTYVIREWVKTSINTDLAFGRCRALIEASPSILPLPLPVPPYCLPAPLHSPSSPSHCNADCNK